MRGKSGKEYVDTKARGLETTAAERAMMRDMALTASELYAGLEGVNVVTWMDRRAYGRGVDIRTDVMYIAELNRVLVDNARAHNVSLPDYLVVTGRCCNQRLGALWGSHADAEAYLNGRDDRMNWGNVPVTEVARAQVTDERFVQKKLAAKRTVEESPFTSIL